MTAKRKRNVPRPAETYRGAIRNLARDARNKRGTDKREARAAYLANIPKGLADIAEMKSLFRTIAERRLRGINPDA
mgnify:CR=1 FL=1